MNSFFAAALSVCLAFATVSVSAATDVETETNRIIRTFERRFRVEGRGYFRPETDLHRWMLTTRDVAREARDARGSAGLAVAPLSQITSSIERHCQIVTPACVAAVLVLTSQSKTP